MSNKVKWGVLGYAKIARKSVIPAILKASNSDFYAIASSDSEKLKQCTEKFSCRKGYTNYDDLLNDPEVQAVYIPLPNHLHREWTIKAARKGKHILCEKPLALNSEEVFQMMEECRKNNVKLMEAFMYRYTDRTGKVMEALQSGIIGEICHIDATFGFTLNRENNYRMVPELGGGSLYDVGCYPIDFFGMITNSTPVSMQAEYHIRNGIDVSFSAVLKYENNIICNANSWFNAYPKAYAEITGDKGIIQIPDVFFGSAGTITVITAEGVKEIDVKESERYVLEVEDFADAIINDRPPRISLDESIRNMRTIEQLQNRIER